MRKSARLVSLMISTALVSILGASCAENGTPFAASSDRSIGEFLDRP